MWSPDGHPVVLLDALRLRAANQTDIYMHSPHLLCTRQYQAWFTPVLQRVDGVVPSAVSVGNINIIPIGMQRVNPGWSEGHERF